MGNQDEAQVPRLGDFLYFPCLWKVGSGLGYQLEKQKNELNWIFFFFYLSLFDIKSAQNICHQDKKFGLILLPFHIYLSD